MGRPAWGQCLQPPSLGGFTNLYALFPPNSPFLIRPLHRLNAVMAPVVVPSRVGNVCIAVVASILNPNPPKEGVGLAS